MTMLSAVLVAAVMATVGSVPAPVTARYSWVYDTQKHRQHLPNCPAMEEVKVQVDRAIALWEHEGEALLARIRTVAAMDSFPSEPIIIYVIGCGRGISDPLTISPYAGGPDGPFVPLSDEDVLQEIAHELLHHIALSDEYDALWWRLKARHRTEGELVFNHIIVMGLEARLYGYAPVAKRYRGSPAYARALELALVEQLVGPVSAQE